MNQKTFVFVASIIFLLVTIGHVLRVVFSLEIAFGDWVVPLWASYIGLVVAGFLAYTGLSLSKKAG